MYINCYLATETKFDHNGEFKVWIDEGKGQVYRTLNGPFYVQFEVSHSELFVSYLQPRMFVKIPTPRKENPYQPFRIVDVSDTETGVVFTAYHYIWDLTTSFLPHINIVAQTRAEACQYIIDKAQEAKPHPFKIKDLDNPQEQKNLQIVRYNPLVALMGSEDNTVMNRFGTTEFDFDNNQIYVMNRLGRDTGYLIKENKNLTSYTKDLDYKPLATRIVPQGANELLLPEYYIDSPKIGDYDEIFYKHVEFPEIAESEEMTREEALEELRKAARKLFSEAHIDQPDLSWTVAFDANTEAGLPEELKELLKLDIGDSVIIYKDGLRLESRILEYVYDFVIGKYDEITISSLSKSFGVSLDKAVADLKYRVDNFNSIITNLDETLTSKIEQEINSVTIEVSKIDASLSGLRAEINDQISDVQDAVGDLGDTLTGSFADGIIDEAEALAIAEHLRRLDTEKADIDAQYEELYNNPYLIN